MHSQRISIDQISSTKQQYIKKIFNIIQSKFKRLCIEIIFSDDDEDSNSIAIKSNMSMKNMSKN